MKRKILNLIKVFDSNPNRLVNFLIKNNAFTNEFIEQINKSVYLDKYNKKNKPVFFKFDELIEFEESILLNGIEDLTKQYNEKLNMYISKEDYEAASLLKKYMNDNNIEIL